MDEELTPEEQAELDELRALDSSEQAELEELRALERENALTEDVDDELVRAGGVASRQREYDEDSLGIGLRGAVAEGAGGYGGGVLGGEIGGALGTLAAPVVGPAGPIAGAGLGSAVGGWLGQMGARKGYRDTLELGVGEEAPADYYSDLPPELDFLIGAGGEAIGAAKASKGLDDVLNSAEGAASRALIKNVDERAVNTPRQAQKATRLFNNWQDALRNEDGTVNPSKLRTFVLGQIGGFADRSVNNQALSRRGEEVFDSLMRSRIFEQAKNVDDFAKIATSRAAAAPQEKLRILSRLDTSGVKVSRQDIEAALAPTRNRISELSKSAVQSHRELAATLQQQMDSLLDTPAFKLTRNMSFPGGGNNPITTFTPGPGMSLSELEGAIAEFNLGRRELDEFTNRSLVGEIADTREAAHEVKALSEVQEALEGLAMRKADDASAVIGVHPQSMKLKDLDREYGAMKLAERMATAKESQLAMGMADRSSARAIGTGGADNRLQSPTKAGLARYAWDNMTGAIPEKLPSDGIAQSARKFENTFDNIRAAIGLANNQSAGVPAELRTGFAGLSNLRAMAGGSNQGIRALMSRPMGETPRALGMPPLEELMNPTPRPYPNGFPRDPKQYTVDTVRELNVAIHRNLGGIPDVVKQANDQLMLSLARQDSQGFEKALAVMARACPQAFEGGYGIGGIVRDPMEQEVVMSNLRRMKAEGKISITDLARQASAFNNKDDLRIISPKTFKSGIAQPRPATNRPTRTANGVSPRQQPY